MSASVSLHGFETVRGRGYRPEEVDRRVEGIAIDRDSCWERAARLTVLANEMTAEVEELRERVAQMPPQTYESLGDQARLILTTAESEAHKLRAEAEAVAERARDEAEAYEREVREAARVAAERLRADTEDRAVRHVEAARDEAERLRAESRKDAERLRDEANAALKEMGRRSAEMLEEQESTQAEQWDALGRELAGHEAELEKRVAELEELGRVKQAEARRSFARTEEAARHGQEDAEARGEELIAKARIEVERIERATERVLREHEDRASELRTHMKYVRNTLAALTGKAPVDEDDKGTAEGSPAGARPAADPDKEDTLEAPVRRTEN